jgi:tRNA-guanine family transglycosylase
MVHEIETPFLWIAQLIDGKPKPWKHFSLDGVMVNAYEILGKTKANNEVRRKGIHGYLEFQGPIMMDSGGFQFMKKEELDMDPKKVLKLYEESKPNFGVILDHPLGPNLSHEEKMDRWFNTLTNTRIMVANHNAGCTELVPAVHGHKIDEIAWFLQQLDKISAFDCLGIGSLVPSVFSTKGAGGIANVVEIVNFVRKTLPDRKIHVFGVGSTITMHLMFYAGANSVDSSGWRTKAAYGAIQLPGIGDRYITQRKRHKTYRDLSESEKELLAQCECPVCKKEGLEKLKRSFTSRALHNAWIFQKEVEKARELIKMNEYESYVQEILIRSSLLSAFKFAMELKKK